MGLETNDIEGLRRQYEKQRKRGFIAGCIFLTTATVFGILSFVLKKPDVLYGVIAQLFAAMTLLWINRKR